MEEVKVSKGAASFSCSPDNSGRKTRPYWDSSHVSNRAFTHSAAVSRVSPLVTNRHALPGSIRVSAGGVLCAVAACGSGGFL